MSKITTADCKRFLVSEIAKNPNIVLDIYGGFNSPGNLLPTALVEKKWKRTEKFKATGDHDMADYQYSLWFPVRGPSAGEIVAEDLATVRVFHLDPDQFDDSVGFMVLEDNAGQLLLGEYIGD
jgi:hypothetical protein